MPIDYKAVGRRIAHYRKLNGLTAGALSERVQRLSRDNLAKIETGKRESLDIGMLLDIAAALGVPHLALLLDLDEPEAEADAGPTVIQRMVLSNADRDDDGVLHGTGVEVFRRPMKVSESLAWNSFDLIDSDLITTRSQATDVVRGQVASWRRYRRARAEFDLAHRSAANKEWSQKERLYATRELWSAFREASSLHLKVPAPGVADPDDDLLLGARLADYGFDQIPRERLVDEQWMMVSGELTVQASNLLELMRDDG